MKQAPIFLIFLAFLLLLLCIPVQAEDPVTVSVTIADGTGSLPLTQVSVKVTDADDDGTLTVNDALICAHDRHFSGGASAGYASEQTQYGISFVKLWGVENGGSYGCFVNNEPIVSLADPIQDQDVLSRLRFFRSDRVV